ncbi:MAG: formimidoylglutamase [Bacteroidetes bacterium 4572_77]|nr:MAG: formimidoylglutamase [Bacteroidetes bacterium 4572_77]
MKHQKNTINAEYKASEKAYWEGRKSNPDMENQYWHQEINLVDFDQENSVIEADIAILAYVCDEGVRRNRGRIGAHEGPKAIRDRLAKLPMHFENKRLVDAGDVVCIDDDMEACQLLFSKYISRLITQGIFPIALGGGHDMSYGHFMGIWDVVKHRKKKKIGIINFDAHFDLRPVETKSNSGTPFFQIIEELKNTPDVVKYFAIGIQQQSNTKELFHIAKEDHISYAINYDCESSSTELDALKSRLKPFIEEVDYLYVTIDMDGFSSAYAPGVSAPSPLGFTPYFVFKMLRYLLQSKKVISFDIAELNPSLDRDNLTASLAAKIIDFVVMEC